MSSFTTIQTIGIWGAAVSLVLYFLYRRALPKPIPGIPYNKNAAQHIVGDVPEAMATKKATGGSLFDHLHATAKQLNAPVSQVFMQPFGKPWVVVADPYEAHDIRTRRMQEFDRSYFFDQVFGTLLPKWHGKMLTGNEWKAHRKLISDVMSTRFLHDVAAPQMWTSAMSLIELWKTKARLADGRPWSAGDDIFKGALDIIWAATFGAEMGSAQTQRDFLAQQGKLQFSEDVEKPVSFPVAKDLEDFVAMLELGDSVEYSITSPWPKLTHWLALNGFPSLRRATRRKDNVITQHVLAAYEKLSKVQADDVEASKHFNSALDLVVTREMQMASREGRKVNVTSQVVIDELFSLILAGHDTTSTFLCWALKFLSDDPRVQRKLHEAIRSAFIPRDSQSSTTRPVPSVTEIVNASIPYLDAVGEEVARRGYTIPALSRVTKCDTEILGHRVPAGINVFMPTTGPGFIEPMVGSIDDSQRSKSSLDQKAKLGMWDSEDMAEFKPERWLKEDRDGNVYCDREAGPVSEFGSGPRACFGKKWALLEIKIILTLIFWHFELLPTPPELSTYGIRDGITGRPSQTYVRLREIVR